MGFRFNKRIKICKGVSLNIGKKGINSISIGKRGAHVNIGKKGVRKTVGIPGTGLSYTNYKKYDNKKQHKVKTYDMKFIEATNIEDILSIEEIERTKYTKYNKFVMFGSIACGILMFAIPVLAVIEIPLVCMLACLLLSKRFRYVLYMRACKRALRFGARDAALLQVNRALKNGYDIEACNKIINKIEGL